MTSYSSGGVDVQLRQQLSLDTGVLKTVKTMCEIALYQFLVDCLSIALTPLVG